MAGSPVALLTGATRGLGAAICVALLNKGYKVCVSAVQKEKGQRFGKELQERYGCDNVRFVVCDVTEEEDYKGLFDFALNEFKRIDLVVNNAGIVLEQNPRKMLDVNLMGPIIGCKLALQYMGKRNNGKGGIVINTSSTAGLTPFHPAPVYSATKHGLIGLTRSYGTNYHLDRDGIIFMAICPSVIDTDMARDGSRNSLIPGYDVYAGREVMTPEYVAQGLLKLLEDRINGSTLKVTSTEYTYIRYHNQFKDI